MRHVRAWSELALIQLLHALGEPSWRTQLETWKASGQEGRLTQAADLVARVIAKHPEIGEDLPAVRRYKWYLRTAVNHSHRRNLQLLAKRLYVQIAEQSLPSLRGSRDVVPERGLLRRYNRVLQAYHHVKQALLSTRRDTEAALKLRRALPALDSVEAGALVDAMRVRDAQEIRIILLGLAAKPYGVSASTARQAIARERNRQRAALRLEQQVQDFTAKLNANPLTLLPSDPLVTGQHPLLGGAEAT